MTGSAATGPRHRRTSRVVLLDGDDRVLLFLTVAPDSSGTARWITPGGGAEPGETHSAAARRELFEETGLDLPDFGAPIWSHDFVVDWDAADHDSGHAEFFQARTAAVEPSRAGWTAEEHRDVLAHRWWPLDELQSTDEPYEPAELPELVARSIDHGARRADA